MGNYVYITDALGQVAVTKTLSEMMMRGLTIRLTLPKASDLAKDLYQVVFDVFDGIVQIR